MPLSWHELREARFDRSVYRDDLPVGQHQITLDLAAWGKGASAGIHLFFTTQGGDKFWSFIKWWGATPEYVLFSEAQPGEQFSLVIETRIKSGKPFIRSATKV